MRRGVVLGRSLNGWQVGFRDGAGIVSIAKEGRRARGRLGNVEWFFEVESIAARFGEGRGGGGFGFVDAAFVFGLTRFAVGSPHHFNVLAGVD
jgi:hypothetical protein